MQNFNIELVETNSVKPDPSNARTHPKRQIEQIAKSMKAFGCMNPLIVDRNGTLIAGHGRWLAAKSMDMPRVPVLRADHLTEAEARAYALADNKIALNANWDNDLLRIQLEELMKVDLDFSIDVTGFSTPEIDFIVHGSDPLDVSEPASPSPCQVVSQAGDIWMLGRHVVICGDCRDHASAVRALGVDERVGLVVTDPPYNVKIDGHVSGLGATQHREFAMASGEMTSPEFQTFLSACTASMANLCRPGALLYQFMDWRHLPELQAATASLGLEPVNLCVWVKNNGGMGSFYRSQHELVWVVKWPGAPAINNVELGRHGRYRTNVWRYAGMNSFSAERDDALKLHPTVKPVAMIRDVILDASHPHDWVLDAFLGSGTTLLAAEQSGRRCLGIELDPGYVDVAIGRWQELTGGIAQHLDLCMPWKDVRVRRGIGGGNQP